jgi:hypothetical protein
MKLRLTESTAERNEVGRKEINEETKKNLIKIIQSILNDPQSYEFSFPVDFKKYNILDYPLIIKYPSDLNTVKNKLNENKYNSIQECLNDIQLIWDDCKTFNPPQSEFVKMANHCEKLFRKKFEKIFKKSLTYNNNNNSDNNNNSINLNEEEDDKETNAYDFDETEILSVGEKKELLDNFNQLVYEGNKKKIKYIYNYLKYVNPDLIHENDNKIQINIDGITRSAMNQIYYLIKQ